MSLPFKTQYHRTSRRIQDGGPRSGGFASLEAMVAGSMLMSPTVEPSASTDGLVVSEVPSVSADRVAVGAAADASAGAGVEVGCAIMKAGIGTGIMLEVDAEPIPEPIPELDANGDIPWT
jgi:hypothetical protein